MQLLKLSIITTNINSNYYGHYIIWVNVTDFYFFPISKYLFIFSGLGGMHGEFWGQFSPTVYISVNVLMQYGISFLIALFIAKKLDLKKRIPTPLAGGFLIWVGGLAMIAPNFLRILTSMVEGGGASFALMTIAAPIILFAKVIFITGLFFLLLAIKPDGKYSYHN